MVLLERSTVTHELRRALEVLGPARAQPKPEQRQHALEHARTATLLLSSSPEAKIVGACGRVECYEGATKVTAARSTGV